MADQGSTTKQAGTHEESGVHRLRDIVVEEVSLVDRAANKRRFLVVKRSSQMADDGKPKDRPTPGDSTSAGSRAGKKPKPTEAADVDKAKSRATGATSEDDDKEDDPTEKARPSGGSEEDDEDDEAEASKAADEDNEDEDDEDIEDGEGNAAAGAAAKTGKTRTHSKPDAPRSGEASGDGGKGGRSRSTEKAEDGDLVLAVATKNAVLRALAQALERLMAVANQVKDASEPGDDSDATVPDDLMGEIEDVGELLEDIGEQLADSAERSVGKKRAAPRGRTARTDDARDGGAKGAVATGEVAKTDASKADIGKAGRRMARERLDRFRKALELLSSVLQELTEAKESPAPSAGSAEKPVAKRDTAPGMRELMAGVQELTRIVQRQEEQLVRLQKARATSNAIPVEGSSRRREIQEISWPLDMNRPITRDRVDKAISFYDEE